MTLDCLAIVEKPLQWAEANGWIRVLATDGLFVKLNGLTLCV